MPKHIVDEVPGLYRVIALKPFRRTPGVSFDLVPMEHLPAIAGIDRVMHDGAALSPGPVGDVERPWYMHPHQEDNLIVMRGTRTVDVYTLESRRLETFVVGPDSVTRDGELVYDGPAMLVWPNNVFHRIRSGPDGSASLNFAARSDGFDIKTNFNIYDLDVTKNTFRLLRMGYLDQSSG